MCQSSSLKPTSLNDSKTVTSTFTRLCRKMLRKKSSKNMKQHFDDTCSSTSGDSGEDRGCGEIERVFRYIDWDGDGKISPSELQRCVKVVGVQHLTAEEAEEAVKSSDTDGDGLLSLEEFERLMGGDAVSEEEKMAELRDAFLMYNDKSGSITPSSLKRMLSRLGDKKSIDDCEAMIRVFDLNGDGVLSLDEFATMMR